jgi:hypothetical protein
VNNAEELRQMVAAEERQRTEAAALVLNDQPPRKD